MAGVPKLPRINPGTVLNNRDLEPVIPSARRAELADLGEPELWALEEKYDVPIAEIFGADRFALSAPLDALLILNWSRNSQEPSRFRTVDLAERQDLLPAIMKPPGPFYMPADGTPPPAPFAVDPGSYLDLLRETKVVEAVGGVDFAAAARFCEDLVGGATELRG